MLYFLIFLLALSVIFLGISIPTSIIRRKYSKFVIAHSVALKQLDVINNQYMFKAIPNMDMEHSYDNENMYRDISCEDYLTYQLVYSQKKANQALKDTLSNKELYQKYTKQIKETCMFDKYDTVELLPNRKRLKKFEAKIFKKTIKIPTIEFVIRVRLSLTKINGVHRTSKSATFDSKHIKDIMFKLNQKQGTFYLNDDVWKSICRVERGKVTNKMRFAVYNRDHNRCRKCGRRTGNLEIDHIIPIAKGGKSTYDNLQTLCHRCNVKKGSSINY